MQKEGVSDGDSQKENTTSDGLFTGATLKPEGRGRNISRRVWKAEGGRGVQRFPEAKVIRKAARHFQGPDFWRTGKCIPQGQAGGSCRNNHA